MATQKDNGRRSSRLKVILAATLDHEGSRNRVRVLDLSRHGALIAGDSMPSVGSVVTLGCGTQAVSGLVAWRKGDQAGLSFDEQVNCQRFGRKAPATSTLLIRDAGSMDFRRPGFRGNQLSPEERAFMAQLTHSHQIRVAA